MSTSEPRSPTFDGNEAAEQTGNVADASGIEHEPKPGSGEMVERPERADEAAQVIP